MTNSNQNTAILLLEDGTVFRGRSVGKVGTTKGEICFNTGMTGYQEVFTDPSYAGQLLVATNVHIGNYGIKQSESESSKVQIEGFICRNFNEGFDRQNADKSLQQYLEKEHIVAISQVDTRAIVRHIRSKGAMNAIISSEHEDLEYLMVLLKKLPSMNGLELASKVSTKTYYNVGSSDAEFNIAVLDFGIKQSIINNLINNGFHLHIYPAKTPFKTIEKNNPDAYFLSNGPGDPAAMDYAVDTVQAIIQTGKPVFGICLGHQIIARASGLETEKMHHGHRGINHPVKNIERNHSEITSQNHGFVVSESSVAKHKEHIEVTHINLNDNSIEGIQLKSKPVFSVQYHPEASPGPHDSLYLFEQFKALIKK